MSTSMVHAGRGVMAPPNPWCLSLYREQDLWDAITARGGIQGLCCPAAANPGGTPPWIAMPPEGRRYQQIGSIALPVVENTNTLVTSFTVPTGYLGVIVSIINMFTADGFIEGSGDLVWRIRVNRRWVKDYGNIQTTLGSVSSPCMIYRGGIRLATRQQVSYFVSLGAGALGRLNPIGRIVCAAFGWFWPM